MKHLALFFALLFSLNAYCQSLHKKYQPKPIPKQMSLLSYDSYYNQEGAVFEKEYLNPNEIKLFNEWHNKGYNDTLSLSVINAIRSYNNLKKAPATIVQIMYEGPDKNDNYNNIINIGLINSTVKTIKEIVFKFSFWDWSTQLYDVIDGHKYSTIKFKNLTGRTVSNKYEDINDKILQPFHALGGCGEGEQTPFHNRKAEQAQLEDVNITYIDGTTSKQIALFYVGPTITKHNTIFDNKEMDENALLYNGPLKPSYDYCHRFTGDTFYSYGDLINSKNSNMNYGVERKGNGEYGEEDYDDEDGNSELEMSIDREYETASEDSINKKFDEIPPSFNGDLNEWVNKNLNYPKEAIENGIMGKVIVRFMVDKDGNVTQVQIVRSPDPILSREALRLFNSMPKWTPGTLGGKPVAVWLTYPLTFRLQ